MGAKPENCRYQGEGWACDYCCFGAGQRPLLLLPGVGDGFQTAKGLAGPFSLLYRIFSRDWRVYVVSRREALPPDFTTLDMARDLAEWMDALGLDRADVVGVSQGGMIAQQLAIHWPEKVHRLVLAVTAQRVNPVMEEALTGWMAMAERRDFAGIMADTARRSFTGAYQRRWAAQYALLSPLMAPKGYDRFLTLCRSCLSHDTGDRLGEIACPTLVIGAEEDRVVGGRASIELARGIPGARLKCCPGMSHGVYEQAGDFNGWVYQFLGENGE